MFVSINLHKGVKLSKSVRTTFIRSKVIYMPLCFTQFINDENREDPAGYQNYQCN